MHLATIARLERRRCCVITTTITYLFSIRARCTPAPGCVVPKSTTFPLAPGNSLHASFRTVVSHLADQQFWTYTRLGTYSSGQTKQRLHQRELDRRHSSTDRSAHQWLGHATPRRKYTSVLCHGVRFNTKFWGFLASETSLFTRST